MNILAQTPAILLQTLFLKTWNDCLHFVHKNIHRSPCGLVNSSEQLMVAELIAVMWGSDTDSRRLGFPGTAETHLSLFALFPPPLVCQRLPFSTPPCLIFRSGKHTAEVAHKEDLYRCRLHVETQFKFLNFLNIFLMFCTENKPHKWSP